MSFGNGRGVEKLAATVEIRIHQADRRHGDDIGDTGCNLCRIDIGVGVEHRNGGQFAADQLPDRLFDIEGDLALAGLFVALPECRRGNTQ